MRINPLFPFPRHLETPHGLPDTGPPLHLLFVGTLVGMGSKFRAIVQPKLGIGRDRPKATAPPLLE